MAEPPLLILSIESDRTLDQVRDRLDPGPLRLRNRAGGAVTGRPLGGLEPDEKCPTSVGKAVELPKLARLKGIGFLLEQVEDCQARLMIGIECRLERGHRGLHGAVDPDPFALRASASEVSTEIRSVAMFCRSWRDAELVGKLGWFLRVRMSE